MLSQNRKSISKCIMKFENVLLKSENAAVQNCIESYENFLT